MYVCICRYVGIEREVVWGMDFRDSMVDSSSINLIGSRSWDRVGWGGGSI